MKTIAKGFSGIFAVISFIFLSVAGCDNSLADQLYTAEIAVYINSEMIESDATVDLGKITVGEELEIAIAIENKGNEDLDLLSDNQIDFAGEHRDCFSLESSIQPTISIGEQITATIICLVSSTVDSLSAQISIQSTDNNNGTFIINLTSSDIEEPVVDDTIDTGSGIITITNPTSPTFSMFPDDFTLETGGGNTEETIAVSPGSGVTITGYEWLINGVSRSTENTITLDTATNPDWFYLGENILALVVEIDESFFSEQFRFSVLQYEE